MIVGSYWPERSEVTVDLDVLSLSGSRVTISAVLDTGFTGFLHLSLQQVQELGVPLVDFREMELADGTIRPVARYEVSLELVEGGSITIERA